MTAVFRGRGRKSAGLQEPGMLVARGGDVGLSKILKPYTDAGKRRGISIRSILEAMVYLCGLLTHCKTP